MRVRTWITAGLAGCLSLLAATAGDVDADQQLDNSEALVELGRRLFFEPAASRSGTVSCASCHDPEHGFSDPRKLSLDETGLTPRHSQPLLDLPSDAPGFHWDGEFETVRQLLVARVASPDQVSALRKRLESKRASTVEKSREVRRRTNGRRGSYGMPAPVIPDFIAPMADGAAEDQLAHDGRYSAGFRGVFGTAEISTGRIIAALDAYVHTLHSTESPFDRFRREPALGLEEPARRGLALFEGRAGCTQCHPIDGARPDFSDGAFHNTGVARRARRERFKSARKARRRVGFPPLDTGRQRVSLDREDLGRFKTPSLRDVAKRAPYMHDGSFATLRDVVDYYGAGGTMNSHLDPAIKPLELSDLDKDDLVAFLESLTGDERPGLGPVPKQARRLVLLVVDARGEPMPGFALTVRPTGDRFERSQALPSAFDAETDESGRLSLPFPRSTHVAIEADGHEIGLGRPIPDFAGPVSVMCVPTDRVTVRMTWADATEALPETLWACVEWSKSGITAKQETMFRLVRTLNPCEAIYTTKFRLRQGRAKVHFANKAPVVIDLAGGESEPIEVEPHVLFRVPGTEVGDRSETPAPPRKPASRP